MKTTWTLTFLLLLMALGMQAVSAANMTDRLEYPEYWLEQGVVQYSLNNYDRALLLIDNALKQDPTLSSAWLWRGKVLKKMGKSTEADESDVKAREFDPLINDPFRKKVGSLADVKISPVPAARPEKTESKIDKMIESDVDVGKKADPTGPDMVLYDLQAVLPEGSDRVEITASIGNEGVKPTRNFFISFYGSYTMPVSSNDSPIGFYLVDNLLPGTKKTISGFFPVSQIPSGDYYIGAYLDPNNEIMEISEDNNGKTATVRVNVPEVNPSIGPQLGNAQLAVPKISGEEKITVKRADLVVDKITGPETAVPGEAIAITTTVRNAGDVDAGPFRLSMYLSRDTKVTSEDIVLGFGDVPDLVAGKAREGTAQALIPDSVTPGTYYLVALADSQSAVTENDKQNNGRSMEVPILIRKTEDAETSGPAPVPEATTPVESVNTSLSPLNLSDSPSGQVDLVIDSLSGPSLASPGDVISVTTKVRNAGDADAGPFRLSIYLSGDTGLSSDDFNLGYGDVPDLSREKSREGIASAMIPLNISPGTYYLVAMADSLDTISEKDKENNYQTQESPIEISVAAAQISSESANVVVPVTPPSSLTLEPVGGQVEPSPIPTAIPSLNTSNSLPDLIPVNLSSDSVGKAGGVMNVTTTILNDGKGDSGYFFVSLYLSPDMVISEEEDLLVGNGEIESLPAGKQLSGNASAPIPTTIKPGIYYFGLIADSKKQVNETEELNNNGHSLNPIVIQT